MKASHQGSLSAKIKKGLHENGITTRSVVAFLIFGMIVLVFVLSDMSGRRGGGHSMGSAAEVNGQIISLKDFQDEENRLGQYYNQLFGGKLDLTAQRGMLRGEVMNSLISKAVTSQAAENEGIFATDAEVRHMITNELPYFKRDGVFQSDAYKGILEANRMTPGEFEAKLRQDLVNQRARQLFEAAVGVSELQRSAQSQLKATKITLDYIALNEQEFAKAHPVTSEMIAKKMTEPDFKKKVEDYFNSNKAEFETKEQVRAQHILIRAEGDEASLKKAQDKAQSILARVNKEDFGKVAAQVSDDPGSKAKNGDLGYFSRGRMVKEFEDAAFTLPVGKVSGLVKTAYGFHIIKVNDKKAAAPAKLETAQQDIARKLIQKDEYASFAKSIETDVAAGKADAALATLAQNKMTWKQTPAFDLSVDAVPGINSPQAMKAALELTKAQPVAKKLVREGDTQYLIRLKDISAGSPATAQADPEMLERQMGAEAFRQWVDSYKKKAKIETNTALLTEQQ